MRTLIAILLCATAALRADAAVAQSIASSPSSVALAFYERYGAGDLDGLTALATADLASTLRAKLAGRFRTRCLHLVHATVISATTTDAAADVTVDALLTIAPRNRAERYEPHVATFHLVRAGDRWQIAGWELREQRVTAALAAAPTEAARAAILASEPAAATPLLSQLLADRALQAANEQSLPLAGALAALAERVARGNNDLSGLAAGLSIDSIVLRREPPVHPVEALRAAKEAVALAEQTDDPDLLAKTLLRLGRVQREQQFRSAPTAPFERTIALAGELEDISAAAHAASQLSGHYTDRGDQHRALEYALQAQHFASASGNLLAVTAAEMSIATIYQLEGDLDVALKHHLEVLRLSRLANYRDGELATLTDLATLYRLIGDSASYLPIADEILSSHAGPDTIAPVLMDRADYFLARGELQAAERDALAGLATAKQSADRRQPPDAQDVLARVRLAQGRYRETLALLDAADSFQGAQRFTTAFLRARTLRRMGRRRDAVKEYRRALQFTEDARERIAGQARQRRLFFATRVEAYVELTSLLAELHAPLDALGVADESKGRALLDILESGRPPSAQVMSEVERARERELLANIAALRSRAGAKTAAALQEAYTALDVFRTEIESRYPDLRLQREASATVTRESLAALLPDARTAFVEYVMTANRLHAFVVRKTASGTSVTVRTTTVARDALERRAARFVAALAARDLRYMAPARKLYDLLLAPLAAQLQGVRTICIVPDGVLWQVPFEALLGPDRRFVVSRMATFYAPSIAVYARMARTAASRPKARETFLGFADPPLPAPLDPARTALRSAELAPLPDATREVEQIARLYGSSRAAVHVGSDALEQRVKEESASYDVIHFATHGVLDDRNPMYSHLLLAPTPGGGEDGLLETWEMMRLDLHAELTVLSACDTARGTFGEGEGIVGMSWALFAAGCPSTIATEWKVDSASAADLMLAFYRQWLHGRATTAFAKAEALQHARLQLLRDPQRQHPFYWAPYVLIGSGR